MAGLMKRFLSHFGLFKDDSEKCSTGKQPRGFGVRVAVPAENKLNAPVVYECKHGAGGVQGLRWYAEDLKMDEDGDVAQEFLYEVMPEASDAQSASRLPSFKATMQTRPVKLKGPVCTLNGNVHQSVESCTGVH